VPRAKTKRNATSGTVESAGRVHEDDDSTLFSSLATLTARAEVYATRRAHERWHEAARLLDALKHALETTSPVAENRVLLPIRNARTQEELNRAAATAKASKWWGRDAIAVVLRETAESLNAKVRGTWRGDIPRLGEVGPVEIKLRDDLAAIMKRGRCDVDDGPRPGTEGNRLRDLNAAELAAYVDMLAQCIDLDGRVLPPGENREARFARAIGKVLKKDPRADAERTLIACARELGVKRAMFEAARKREERTSPRG
jgi:hypothetical protein